MVERSFVFVSPEQLSERWDPGFYLTDFNHASEPRMKLGDLVSLRKQNPLKRPELYFKYVEISSIDTELGEIVNYQELKHEELPARARYWAWRGDLVTALIRPDRGAVAIIPAEYDGCAVSSALSVLATKNVEPEYVHFLLRSERMRSLMSQQAKGSAVPTLGMNDLLSLQVPLYRKTEVDDLLNELKIIKKELKVSIGEIKEISKFIEDTVSSVLPALDTVKSKRVFTLDYSKLNVERFDVGYYAIDTQGINEALLKTGHPLVSLGELAIDMEVGINTKIDTKIDTKGIPVLRNVNIQADGTIDDSRFYLKPQSRIVLVKPGSLLFSLSGSNIGTVAVASDNIVGHAYNQSLVCLRLKPNINPWFFALFMNSSYGKKQVERLQSISVRPYLTLSSLRKIKIPLLPLEQQNKIGEKASNVIKSRKERYAYWLQKYEELEKKLWGEL